MSRHSGQVRDEYGRPIPGVAIYVFRWDADANAAGDSETLLDDAAGPLANPVISDDDGLYSFNSIDGQKLLEFHYGGKVQERELILVGALPVPEATFGGLFADASGLTIPTGMDLIVTTGYYALDVGAAVYVYDAAVNSSYVAAHPRSSFISVNGRGFRLSVGQDITPEMLGGTDSTALALAYAIKGSIVWPNFAAPTFSNSAYYSSAQYLTNAATPGTWYSALQGGQKATEALTAGVIVPVGATNHQTNAVSGYIRSDRAQPANGGDVAAYFQAVANATNSAVFALNAVMADTTGLTGQKLNNEIDVNVNAADTTVTGLNLVLVANTTLTGSRNAFRADKAFGTNGWSNGFVTADGAIDTYAAYIGSQTTTTGTDRDSQKVAFVSYNAANTRFIATILGDHFGGMALRPGNSSAAIAFQDATGSANWFSVDSTGANLPTGKVLSVNSVQVVGARNTGWAADTGTAKKTATATYTVGSALTVGAAYVQAEVTAIITRQALVEAALRDSTQEIKALKDALIAHGLVGA